MPQGGSKCLSLPAQFRFPWGARRPDHMAGQFCPERLSLMRERRGLSISRLAAKADVAERAIRDHEAGRATPRDSNLHRLSAALAIPSEFLFGPRISGLGYDAATFRAATKLPVYRRKAALAAGSLAMHLADWLADRFDFPPVNIPNAPGGDPEISALSVRATWGLETGQLRTWCTCWKRMACWFSRWLRTVESLMPSPSGVTDDPSF